MPGECSLWSVWLEFYQPWRTVVARRRLCRVYFPTQSWQRPLLPSRGCPLVLVRFLVNCIARKPYCAACKGLLGRVCRKERGRFHRGTFPTGQLYICECRNDRIIAARKSLPLMARSRFVGPHALLVMAYVSCNEHPMYACSICCGAPVCDGRRTAWLPFLFCCLFSSLLFSLSCGSRCSAH